MFCHASRQEVRHASLVQVAKAAFVVDHDVRTTRGAGQVVIEVAQSDVGLFAHTLLEGPGKGVREIDVHIRILLLGPRRFVAVGRRHDQQSRYAFAWINMRRLFLYDIEMSLQIA